MQQQTSADYDALVAGFYKAASGAISWGQALAPVSTAMQGWVTTLYSVDLGRNALNFCFETGTAPAEAALDFIRTYHHHDPSSHYCIQQLEVGQWGRTQDVFDERYVAGSKYYQDFLIPYGGRWSSGCKVYQDAHHAVVWAVHRGVHQQPLSDEENAFLHRLSRHVGEAVQLYLTRRLHLSEQLSGLGVLQRMRQPILLIDAGRRIGFANRAARDHLTKACILVDHHGLLMCRQDGDDAHLMMALRELGLDAQGRLGEPARRDQCFFRIPARGSSPSLGIYLFAIRPQDTLEAFGGLPQALVMLHDLSQPPARLDPYLVAATFDLTPAEAKVAAALARGYSKQEIADGCRVSINTVRSQAQSVLDKMGVARQAELVSVLSSMPASMFGEL